MLKLATRRKAKKLSSSAAPATTPIRTKRKWAPHLKGLYKKAKLNNGKKPTDAVIKEIINKGGNGMPPYEELLSDEEKANVIAYLKTL